jgi:hypothetical protein
MEFRVSLGDLTIDELGENLDDVCLRLLKI